jgi:hypothetical protein
MSKKNKRKHFRMDFGVEVELIISEQQVIQAKSQDMSDGGFFLMMDDNEFPPIGTEVKVRLKDQMGDGEEPPLMRAIIVRRNAMGIGLKFLN